MRAVFSVCMVCLVVATAAVALTPVRAEVIEEIVALVNGDIITKSDFAEEEKMMVADIYRRFTGEELARLQAQGWRIKQIGGGLRGV